MTDTNHPKPTATVSGQDVFAEVTSLSKKRISEMLVRMIASAGDYRDWNLSDDQSARLVKLLKQGFDRLFGGLLGREARPLEVLVVEGVPCVRQVTLGLTPPV